MTSQQRDTETTFLQSPPLTHSSTSTSTAIKLKVCCYGSSSSQTPQPFLDQAYQLGKLLALRGHVCVNGAGRFGCMAAMNDGAMEYGGDVLGVIHEMFVVDGADWTSSPPQNTNTNKNKDQQGSGAHRVFDNDNNTQSQTKKKPGRRQLLVAGGHDLQERKRLLVEQANAIVVLPGGPGTWDELMEMTCAKNINLTSLPILVINTHDYYTPLQTQMQQCYQHALMPNHPDDLVTFCTTALEAVQKLEDIVQKQGVVVGFKRKEGEGPKRRKGAFLKKGGESFMGDFSYGSFVNKLRSFSSSLTWANEEEEEEVGAGFAMVPFTLGVTVGVVSCLIALRVSTVRRPR